MPVVAKCINGSGNSYRSVDRDSGILPGRRIRGNVDRGWFVIAMSRSFAFAFFLVFAMLFDLAFNLAVAVPVFLLVFALVMSSAASLAMAAFILMGIGDGLKRDDDCN